MSFPNLISHPICLCAAFTGDSLDPTLCTDDIDDVHIPQISGDAGSQGEWDPNQATSFRPRPAQQIFYPQSSPVTESLRTVMAGTQACLLSLDMQFSLLSSNR